MQKNKIAQNLHSAQTVQNTQILQSTPSASHVQNAQKVQNARNLSILYQDTSLAVIYKPDGMLSVPYSGSSAKCALSIFEEMMRKRGTYSSKTKPYAVHRLDRDTSGVMMIALNERAKNLLMDNWQKIVTKREYRALCYVPQHQMQIAASGTIDAPLAYNAYHQAYVPRTVQSAKMQKGAKLVSATTHYRVLLHNNKYALFALELDTGRKNQIRAHLASIGYPIVGDAIQKSTRQKQNPLARLCLHARTLCFVHPFSKEELCFEVAEDALWQKFAKS